MMDLKDIVSSDLPLFEIFIKIMEKIRFDFLGEKIISLCKKKIQEFSLIISNKLSKIDQLKKLLFLFYKQWNFGILNKKYKLSNMLWLDKVFIHKIGCSFSLGIILMYIANQLKLFMLPIIFPTQLILKFVDLEKKIFYINPTNGEFLNKNILKKWLQGNISPMSKLDKKDLYEANSLEIIKKVLDLLKISLIEEKNIELALNVSNILLKLKPKDPYEIRDRGLIFSQLNCFHIAIPDLIYFVEQCPEDPISDIIKMQIHTIKQKKIVFH
ncbi:tetratricopeptide repeat protein [Buchnera aphidicola]|uniref:Protein SirB1 N-terminal domain-containing protein n=1 Tax=Buchnera aphidicola subsp. Cinara cedri (strain Cc) TaxID=372461 RepID=Q057V9_BUCCC|nr:tetratricopeptide repeat protein [Buchnera aphidicola]ABJ90590.1 hypothetical protein BCc_113 [Buchnera aphidicola BCc]